MNKKGKNSLEDYIKFVVVLIVGLAIAFTVPEIKAFLDRLINAIISGVIIGVVIAIIIIAVWWFMNRD